MSMLRQLPQDIVGASALSVKVNAFAPNPPDPMLRADIDDIESLRSNKESDMFESVRPIPSVRAATTSKHAASLARPFSRELTGAMCQSSITQAFLLTVLFTTWFQGCGHVT